MSDTDGKKPLGLGGGAPRSGQVKQSFSHGRTKSVVVETKRKRVVVPAKPGAAGAAAPVANPHLGDPSKRPAGISDAEMERRLGLLGFGWADALHTQAYTVQNIGLVPEDCCPY